MSVRSFLLFLTILNCGIASAKDVPQDTVCPVLCPVKEYQVAISCPHSNSNLQLVSHTGTYDCINGGDLAGGPIPALGCMYISTRWNSAYQIKNSISIKTKNMNELLDLANIISDIESKRFNLFFNENKNREGPYLSIIYSLNKNNQVGKEIWRFLFTGLEDFTQDGLEESNTFKVLKRNAYTETSKKMYAKVSDLILSGPENQKADDYFTGLNCKSTFTALK